MEGALSQLSIIAAASHEPVEMPDSAREIPTHGLLKENLDYVVVGQIQDDLGFGSGFFEIGFRCHRSPPDVFILRTQVPSL
ncbi:MAG: hypothetical protein JSR99_05015 [Proteobacteria bacterium]|nr:hypothetical protein [Pseudomonadota bacterium]